MIEATEQPYLMSFGTGGLFINESVAIAKLHRTGENWDATAVIAIERGAFPVRKLSSARRSIREIVNRLKRLSDTELDLLKDGQRSEQSALLWLSACRAYRFIREFAVEVLCEKHLSLQSHLTYDDFDSFYYRKAEWSDKLDNLSASTKIKLRAVLFRIMREADIISKDDRILGAMLTTRFVDLISGQDARELSYFPGGMRYV